MKLPLFCQWCSLCHWHHCDDPQSPSLSMKYGAVTLLQTAPTTSYTTKMARAHIPGQQYHLSQGSEVRTLPTNMVEGTASTWTLRRADGSLLHEKRGLSEGGSHAVSTGLRRTSYTLSQVRMTVQRGEEPASAPQVEGTGLWRRNLPHSKRDPDLGLVA